MPQKQPMTDKSLRKQLRLLTALLQQGYLNEGQWNTGPSLALRNELEACGLILRSSKTRWEFKDTNRKSIERHQSMIQGRINTREETCHLPPKAQAVAQTGDAHKARGSQHKYYLLNARGPCHWYHLDEPDNRLDLYQACQFSGPVCLTFHPKDDLACDQPLALLENIEPLHFPERMTGRKHFGCLLYYKGQLANSLLQWLSHRQRAPEVWLFPDYDYVGLGNYLRLKETLPNARLFIPDDLEDRIQKHHQGCHQRPLDQYQYIDLDKLHRSQDEQVKRVLRVIESTGQALDQEALLIPT